MAKTHGGRDRTLRVRVSEVTRGGMATEWAKSWTLTLGSGEVIGDLDQSSIRGGRHLSYFI